MQATELINWLIKHITLANKTLILDQGRKQNTNVLKKVIALFIPNLPITWALGIKQSPGDQISVLNLLLFVLC